MRITFIAVILLFWTRKRPTEATLPGLSFFLDFPAPTRKVPSPTTKSPPSHSSQNLVAQSPHSQNEFTKLQKLGHSTFVSTYHNEGNKLQQKLHFIQQGQPEIERKPEVEDAPPQNFLDKGQETASATNHGPPQQRSPSHHHHHPIPLTFPPVSSPSSSDSDSNDYPRIISLPPYPSQQLPQSSTYTTSGSSYSVSQGFRPSYGPPKTTKVVRHVSVFVAPQQDSYSQHRQKIRVQGEAEKHVNIIFIKNPDQSKSDTAEIELPPSPEQRTLVYVLNKAQDGPGQVVVNTPEPPKYHPPDVYFIRYKNGQNQQGHQHQYGVPSPPPKQQYGASNQNFTYTLPTSSLQPTELTVMPPNNTRINNTINANFSGGAPEGAKDIFINGGGGDNHLLHTLHYYTSHSQQDSHKHKEEQQLQVKLEQQNHQAGLLHSQMPRDKRIAEDDNDAENIMGKAKQHFKREEQGDMKVNSISPTTLSPLSSPTVVKANTVADLIASVRSLLDSNRTTSAGSNVSLFGSDNNMDIQNSSSNVHDDIIVLTPRNLTSSTSGDWDEEEKGSTGNVSGRPDDFRPYQYAPSLGYNYFGVIGYQIVY